MLIVRSIVAAMSKRSDVKTVMVYTRAPASDFDDWGVDGWESESLIPLMKKVFECVVHICIELNYYILHSSRTTRSSPIVQPTATMDLSRCPLVGVN